MTTKIAITGRKGGTGKTTVACALAALFSQNGLRTLLVDVDPQSNAAFALGADPAAPGTADLLLNGIPKFQESMPSLHVLAGGPRLDSRDIDGLHPEELADLLGKLSYEVIICDCPPGNERLERLAITACQQALVVTDAHPFAVIGAGRVLAMLSDGLSKGRRGPTRWGLVCSRIDVRRTLDCELETTLSQLYPHIPRFVVSQDAGLAAATAARIPVTQASQPVRSLPALKKILEWTHEMEF
jgi:chromosome partitioning protein